jgi:DNA repair exonuclease SbcCD ATPase subunit/DNA repair exonuclease SbcCD nuclease subunit
MRICHLADIHFRAFSRHKEYKEVFEKIFKSIKNLNVDMVVVCGDIVHEKTRITPELVDILNWWFRSLIEVSGKFGVHLILGNHDLNLSNKSRMDVLSPIVNLLDDDNLHFYKESGVYTHGKINLGVFSCFDEDRWDEVKPKKDGINIALFHGCVLGAKTDLDYMLRGAEVSVDFFDEFDFALLGDIHKSNQFLKDNIAYPGSTIQQNYGESIEKGFLLWDIEGPNNYTVEFRPIKNNYPFVTVEWQGDVKSTLEKVGAKNARIRITSEEELPYVDRQQLQLELTTKRSASLTVYEPRREALAKSKAQTIAKTKTNLRDSQALLGLLKSFYTKTWDDAQWKEVESLLTDAMGGISEDDVVRGTEWGLNRMEFSNTFTYNEGNVIDFDKAQGVTGIFAANRSGKSSIIGTIMYTLFNTTDRGPTKNQYVVNVRKSECKVKLNFNVNGEDYTINRGTINKHGRKGKINSSTSLEFLQGTTDRTGEARPQTEKVIRNVIGSPEDFLLTAVAVAGDMNAFIEKKNTARKAVFSKFLELDVCDQLHEHFKESSKGISKSFKSMSERDWGSVISDLETDKEKAEEEIKILGDDLKKIRKKIEVQKKELESISGSSEVVTLNDVLRHEQKLKDATWELEEFKASHEMMGEEMSGNQTALKRINKIKDSFPVEEYKERLKVVQKVKHTLTELKGELKESNRLLEAAQKSVKKLDLVPCGDQFPTCRYIKDSHGEKKRIPEYQQTLSFVVTKLEEKEMEIEKDDEEELVSKIDKYTKLISKGLKLETVIERTKRQEQKLNTDIKDKNKEISDLSREIEEMKEVVVDLDDDRGAVIVERIRKMNREENDLDKMRMELASRQGQIKTEIKHQTEEQHKYKKLREKWLIYERLIHAFSKKGIPSQIISARLPEVNEEIARIIAGVAPFKIELEVNENDGSLEILMNDNGDRYPIELSSGMEKKVASIAIRVALMNISNLPKPDMLFIDEAFDTFDEKNVDLCARMFVALKRWFKNVVIISHNEQVKNIADNLIEIDKIGKDSHVWHG